MSPNRNLALALLLPLAACGGKSKDDTGGSGSSSATVCIDEDLGNEVNYEMAAGSTEGDDFQVGTCGDSQVGTDSADYGYTWTAPASAGYTFTTAGSSFNTVLAILDGDCNGAVLACNDDLSFDNQDSEIYIKLVEGQKIVIVVDGYDVYQSGAYELHVLQDI